MSPEARPAPALVVIGGGPALTATQQAAARDAARAALREALLKVLPAVAHVTEISAGAGDTALAAAYARRHPGVRWDVVAGAGALAPGAELVLLADGLPADGDALLLALGARCAASTRLIVCARNGAQAEVLERLVEADFTPVTPMAGEASGETGRDSPASLFKRLLDAGWMPDLAGQTAAAPLSAPLRAAAHAAADAMGVPHGTAERTLGIDWMIVEARRLFDVAPAVVAPGRVCFDVVVPTTRESQLRLNVEVSPGLREVGARLISYRRARHAAEALERSLGHGEADWILYCHQDVYFPRGFGTQLNELLAAIPPDEHARTLIGFAGMGANLQANRCEPAGFVIDRRNRFDHAESAAAVSIDELAIVVSRRSLHRIDPALGWHLWATDLCLTSITQHRVFPRIVRLPLFHNSSNDYMLPEAFHASARVLARKHAGFGTIHTLCGDIAAPAAAAA